MEDKERTSVGIPAARNAGEGACDSRQQAHRSSVQSRSALLKGLHHGFGILVNDKYFLHLKRRVNPYGARAQNSHLC